MASASSLPVKVQQTKYLSSSSENNGYCPDEGELVNHAGLNWKVFNPNGKLRVIVTKEMIGSLYLELLLANKDIRVEICTSKETILTKPVLLQAIGQTCHGVCGQLTEKWDDELFAALKRAGGKVYSNMAVGFDNVDVEAATRHGIAVGNTPGVLTEATAEMAVSLIYSCARRVVEADQFMRAEKYKAWLPNLFIGKLLYGKTLGIIGAGRIGSTVGLMMVRGAKMNIVFYDKYPNKDFENKLDIFNRALKEAGEEPISWKRANTVEEVAQESDVLSLHPNLDKTTFHMVNAKLLNMMKKDAILVNCARGPVVDEVALVEHCRKNPLFYAGLDVYEDEPLMKPGLKDLPNVVVVPHIASATMWTRSGMSVLSASNVRAILNNQPVSNSPDIRPYVNATSVKDIPLAAPSILNAKQLGLPMVATPKM